MSQSRNTFALVFLLFVLCITLQINAQTNKTGNNQNQTEQQKNPPLGSDPKIIAAEDQAKPAEEESPSIWILVSGHIERAIAWIGDGRRTNFFLVVFTALLTAAAFWGIRAANAAKKSANVLVGQTRPHVFAKVWTGIADPKEDGNRGFGFDCQCLLMNHGSVVAIPEIFHLTSTAGLREPVTEIQNGEYIPIGGLPTKKTARFRLVFSQEEWAEIENGRLRVIVYGHLQYSDMISGKSMMTFFEFTLNPSKRHFIQTESKKKNRRT